MILLWELIKKPSASLFRRVQLWCEKIQMSKFLNTELKSDSDWGPDSEVESKSDAELMGKLKSDSNSE